MARSIARPRGATSMLDGNRLAAGRYYGAVDRRFSTSLATLAEVVHAHGHALPEHDHARAYFCLLVAGGYRETVGGRDLDYSPFDVGFHPARIPHRDIVGPHGGRFLCVEIAAPALADCDLRLRGDARLLASEMTVDLVRIHHALRCGTLSPIDVDSVVWALCGGVANAPAVRERSVPAWLRRCLEIVEDDDGASTAVADIAHRVDVHPVHLSREFRQRFRQTLGQYVQKVRIRRACVEIAAGTRTLADVAARAGFADQSHFCRLFKAHVGCTPSAYVAGVRGRERPMFSVSPGRAANR